MKKTLIIILTLITSISIVGCNKESSDVFKFDYTVKKEYEEKISEGLMEAFIDFTKDTKELYETAFNEFEEYAPGEKTENNPMDTLDILEIDNYMYNSVTMYEDFGGWNGQEEHILKLMDEQREIVSDLGLLKLKYTNYTIDKDNNREPEHNLEYFNEELETLKSKAEEILKNVKTFID